jgi:hypothetical protein
VEGVYAIGEEISRRLALLYPLFEDDLIARARELEAVGGAVPEGGSARRS